MSITSTIAGVCFFSRFLFNKIFLFIIVPYTECSQTNGNCKIIKQKTSKKKIIEINNKYFVLSMWDCKMYGFLFDRQNIIFESRRVNYMLSTCNWVTSQPFFNKTIVANWLIYVLS